MSFFPFRKNKQVSAGRPNRTDALASLAVLDVVGDAIVMLNNDGDIVFLNKAAKELFSLEQKEKRPLVDIPLGTEERYAVEEKREMASVVSFRHGRYVFSYRPLEVGGIIVYSDITLQANLEALRSSFFASASHELKTPVAAIRGYAEIGEMTAKDENSKENFRKILREEGRLERLLEDMLWLFRLENVSPAPEGKISLRAIAREIADGLENECEAKGIKIDIDGECEIMMEEKHARSLLSNLIENGVKYGKQGGYVGVELHEHGFSVSDNGIGIKKKDVPRLFERFYRVEEGTFKEGHGLGLSIVKHIVRAYKGEIKVDSVYGEGTTMSVSFPDDL